MLRGICVAVALCTAGPAGAISYDWIATPSNGTATLIGSYPSEDYPFVPQGFSQSFRITFAPSLSVLDVAVSWGWGFAYKSILPNGATNENTIGGVDRCSQSASGCSTWANIAINPGDVFVLFTTPGDYNHCDTAPGIYCAATYVPSDPSVTVTVASINDVSYRGEVSGPFISMSPVPEAATWAMLLIGFAMIGARASAIDHKSGASRLPIVNEGHIA